MYPGKRGRGKIGKQTVRPRVVNLFKRVFPYLLNSRDESQCYGSMFALPGWEKRRWLTRYYSGKWVGGKRGALWSQSRTGRPLRVNFVHCLCLWAGTTLCHHIVCRHRDRVNESKSCDYPIMVRLRPRNLTFIYRVTKKIDHAFKGLTLL